MPRDHIHPEGGINFSIVCRPNDSQYGAANSLFVLFGHRNRTTIRKMEDCMLTIQGLLGLFILTL